ncbi:MAG: universal stress protein, partial [Alphaproteobacteria bacterium]|nr:universal stress protein [Alphaproteobacteria bacterium]
MKNILLPIELHSGLENTFKTCLALARRFDARIEGVALGPDLPDLVAFDMPVSWTLGDQNTWKELAEEAHTKFEAFMASNNVPLWSGASTAPSFRWAGDKSLGDSQAASYGRVFDVAVLGRPGSDRGDPRMATAEAFIFESGRPVLLASPKPVSQLGDTVVISWNRSTETARCVALAMPLLEKAKKVYVL